ncbi:MAG: hypothetical protein P4L99_15760 [Chthoniobacter sp.]|nr:hypothetical protein [Chthoniobacter sp.]
MLHPLRSVLLAALLFPTALLLPGCHREETADSSDAPPSSAYTGPDKVRAEVDAFRFKTRGYYNTSNFQALEKSMAEIRGGEPLFANGAWKLFTYYDSLVCDDSEPESMWQLHERIHKAWISAYPQSITAQVAYANHLVAYGWHARTAQYADKVTEKGWQLLKERLAAAHEVLASAKSLTPQCPMWWRVEMKIALGQEWSHADFAKLYAEAKQVAPQFQYYDTALAYYLLPRWFGQPGDWEKAATAEMQRPNGLGAEGYADVVLFLHPFYDNIFQESQASWPNTHAGLDILRKKYPQSLQIVTQCCKMACLAGDRATAQPLFQQLNGYVDDRVWSKADYDKFHAWAMSGKAP